MVKQAKALNRWIALLLFVALLMAPGAFFSKLVIDNAPERYFPADSPSVVFERQLRTQFPNDQFIFVLLGGPDLYSYESFRRLDKAVRRLELDARIERVLSPVSSDHIRADEFGFAVEPLIDVDDLERLSASEWRDRVLADRFAVDRVAGRDGDSIGLMVRPYELTDSVERSEIQQTVEQVLADEGLEPLMLGMAGPIPLDVAQLHALIDDTLTFVPLTTALVILLVYLLFRSWAVVLVMVLTMSVVGPAVVALLVALGRPYTLVNTIIPTLMLALTAALLIHLFTALRNAHLSGLFGAAAVEHSVKVIRRPAFYASATTALGLGSLGFSPVTPIRDFGLASAVGALLAFVVVLYLLPPMMAAWFRSRLVTSGGGMQWVDALANAIARLGIRRAGWVVLGCMVMFGAAVPLIAQIKVDTDMVAFFKPEHPLSIATREIESRIGGVTPVEIVFQTDEFDALKAPGLLKAMSALRDWLEQQPEIDRSVSVNDVVEEMHWAFHAEDPDYLAIPDNPQLIAQYLLIYDGRDLYDLVNRDFTTARMVLSVNVHETSQVIALIDRIEAHLAGLDLGATSTRLAGFGMLLAEQERLLVQGQLRGLAMALITIFVALLLVFRSLGGALLCMLPNLAPVVGMFAIMGAFGIHLDIATALIAAIAIGIAVDDTIYFYSGYQGSRRRGHGSLRALMHSFRHAGRAVTATTVVLSFTFALFALSDFNPTQHFGLLTMAGLIGALLLDLLLLPALIVLGARWQRQR